MNDLVKEGLELEVQRRCTAWGWKLPTKEVRELAALSLRLADMPVGAALSELNIMTEEKVEYYLSQRPQNSEVLALEWIAQFDPDIRPLIDKIMALKNGYPHYDSLKTLSVHGVMHDPAIQSRCESLRAVVMLIEDSVPVVVFAAQKEMKLYSQEGFEARLNDVIRQRLKVDDVLVAVGKRDEVMTTLGSAKQMDAQDDYGSKESIWFGANAEDKSEKKIVNVFDYCLLNNVTDISIEDVRGGGARLTMRQLKDMVPMPVEPRLTSAESEEIINMLLAKSGANPKGEMVKDPRDGHIAYRSSAGDAYMRLSFIPLGHFGENLMSVSIRLFSRTEADIDLERLRIEATAARAIRLAATRPKGFVLVVGGTNTGKSTTTAGAIGENRKQFGDRLKRLSLERPVERFLPGIRQVNVPLYIKNAQNVYLEAFKRHDPDFIWIGEILGPETAEVCVTAAISGHLVFSTLHANNAVLGYDAISKFVTADKRYQLIEALTLIVAQEMVKEVCPHCRKIEAPTGSEIEAFQDHLFMMDLKAELPEKVAHANREGCDFVDSDNPRRKCRGGYVGIRPVNEILPVTAKVKASMMAMLSGEVIVNGVNHRDIIAEARPATFFQNALQLVLAHEIELEECLLS